MKAYWYNKLYNLLYSTALDTIITAFKQCFNG